MHLLLNSPCVQLFAQTSVHVYKPLVPVCSITCEQPSQLPGIPYFSNITNITSIYRMKGGTLTEQRVSSINKNNCCLPAVLSPSGCTAETK